MNLSERDKQHIWHPFTQHQLAPNNIPIVRGRGAILFDEHGKEYIDAVSSWWTNIFGHANPEIADAIKKQVDILEHVIFAGFTHQPAIELAENLLSILPKNQAKIFFSDNGSTSVEVAIKMTMQFWYNQNKHKKTFIAFKNAYHGDTFGAMSVGARGVFNSAFEPFALDVAFVDVPTNENFEKVIADFKQIIQTKDVAGFIFEPLLLGSGGMLLYDSKHLNSLIEIAKSEQIICIADEVLTGFGRTGKIFATDYLHHKPDIFCLSKGITGGFLPLGITTCTQTIFDAFLSEDKLKTFFHGHSYTANPLACAAANASFKLLISSQEKIQELVDWQQEFYLHLQKNKKIENVRQLGTIVAFDVKTDKTSSYFNSIRDFLYDNFIQRGVILRPLGNTVYVMPPYIISKEELQQIYVVIDEMLDLL
ncbi:MAG: adenosylmethionine--8-amino-7-oxononanoate transaminase [Chitinophagales bacterium]|nr:adenosylmethionine--8-amino-7-oxononanoate transaminase [Bacteroidota bacterium]